MLEPCVLSQPKSFPVGTMSLGGATMLAPFPQGNGNCSLRSERSSCSGESLSSYARCMRSRFSVRLLVEGHCRPRSLSRNKWIGTDTNFASERPVNGDYQHNHQRQRYCDYRGHRHMHPETLEAEEESVPGGDPRTA